MSLLRRAVAPLVERRGFADGGWVVPPPGGSAGSLSSAGTQVTDTSALSIMTFLAGVRILADSVSMTPLQGVTQGPQGNRIPLVEKPVQLTDPFLGVPLQEGLSQLVTSLVLRGNAYALAVGWDGAMNPVQWWILHPDQVHVQWAKNGVREYKVGNTWYDAGLMSHLSSFMLPGATKGIGIIEYCRNSLGLGIALDEVSGSFFKNGVMSSGIISVDAPLDADQMKATAAQFVQNHSGVKRAHLPIVIGGGAKYQPMSLTPEDAQFLQSRQFQQGEIATLLGVPPHLLGMVDKTTSWGTGIEVQGRAFLDYTLNPYFTRLETMFTGWLQPGSYAEFDKDSITKAETKERFAYYNQAFVTGWLNKDEIRLREALPPLPDGAGQTYYTSNLLIPTSDPDGLIAVTPAAAIPTDNPNTGVPNAGD